MANKKNAAKKKKKVTKAVPIKTSTSKSVVPRAIVSKICGLTDPFCEHARGARYPDDSSSRTLPFTHRARYNLISNVTGDLNYLWWPSFGFEPLTFPSLVAGNVVTTWTDFPAQALISGVTKYRIVSSGFIVKSITAPLNASGEIGVRTWPSSMGSAMQPLDLASYNCNQAKNQPLRLLNGMAVVTEHSDQMPQVFYQSSLDTPTVAIRAANGFTPATIYATGVPASTTVAVIETYIHYELCFDDSTGMQQVAVPPPPSNAIVTQAAAKVTSAIPAIMEKGAQATGALIVRMASRAIGNYFGGPVGGAAAGMLTDGYVEVD